MLPRAIIPIFFCPQGHLAIVDACPDRLVDFLPSSQGEERETVEHRPAAANIMPLAQEKTKEGDGGQT